MRVGRYAALIAEQLGLDSNEVELIEQAAVLHDVGKIGIPDSILLKPSTLDPEEIEFMKHHCEYGVRILRGVACHETKGLHQRLLSAATAKSPVLELAAEIAYSHHERWDGSGYPRGLSGEEMPLVGRITAVADVVDALRSHRPYKESMSWDRCFEILHEGRGKHFDPRVLDAFLAVKNEIIECDGLYTDNQAATP